MAAISAVSAPGPITGTIPAVPALLGTEFHCQAAVLDPLRPPFLTNAVRDVIQ